MAAFVDPAERALLAELKEAAIITPAVMEAIQRAVSRVESHSFEDFLLAGAEAIDERQWLSWLIRSQGCYRFGRVRLAEHAETWGIRHERDQPLPANLPYARTDSGMFLVAVLRPDLPVTGYRAAATLTELRELRSDWRRLG